MKALARQMATYHRYHKKAISKITYLIGVPLIVFALMIPFGWIQIGISNTFMTNLTWVGIVLLFLYYLFLDIPLAIGMGIIFFLLALLASVFSKYTPNWDGFWVFVGCFVVGWILQFIGQLFKGKKISLTESPQQVFIAPIVLLAEVMFWSGRCQKLKAEVEKLKVEQNKA